MIRFENSVDVSTYFHLRLAADGTDATGLTITGFDLQYVRSGVAPSAKVDATALAATDSAHGDNQAIEIDATDQPGVYRVDWPDAAFAAGVPEVILTVKVATVFTESLRVQLISATRGLAGTALPDAVPGAAGGVFIAGTNAPVVISGSGDALTLTSTGANGSGLKANANGSGDGITAEGGATGNGLRAVGGATSGSGIRGVGTDDNAGIVGEAGPNASAWGGITGMNQTTGGIGILGWASDGDGLAGESVTGGVDIRGMLEAATLIAIADALLDRDMSTGTDSGSPTVRTVRQALRILRNKWDVAAGTLTVKKEDDTTTSWTSAVTADASAEPIIGHDPASS